LAQDSNYINDISHPSYWEISMFGIELNTASAGVGRQLLTVVRQWFSLYQPNRSYMRGAGPACQAASRKNGSPDTGNIS